jgi:hypothetical protein
MTAIAGRLMRLLLAQRKNYMMFISISWHLDQREVRRALVSLRF